MNRKTALRVTALITAALIALTFAFFAYAEGGNGDGTGGGKDKPLALESSSVSNGAQNVSLTPEIVLNFNKNVVHFTVKENNMKCFSMTDENGKNVPVDVIMGDDQVDPSIKRIVTIKPKSPLEPETTYILKIGKDITSKSGVSLGRDTYISFTTKAAETTTVKPPATSTNKPTTTKQTTAKPSTTAKQTTKVKTSKSAAAAGSKSATKPSTTATTTPETTVKPVSAKQTTVIEKTKREITHRAVSTSKATSAAGTSAPEKTSDTTSVAVTVTETASETEPVTQTETAVLESDLWSWSETEENDTTATYSGSVTQQTPNDNTSEAKENGGARKALPYIISGIIAVIAVPAIALIIKKKKDNNI